MRAVSIPSAQGVGSSQRAASVFSILRKSVLFFLAFSLMVSPLRLQAGEGMIPLSEGQARKLFVGNTIAVGQLLKNAIIHVGQEGFVYARSDVVAEVERLPYVIRGNALCLVNKSDKSDICILPGLSDDKINFVALYDGKTREMEGAVAYVGDPHSLRNKFNARFLPGPALSMPAPIINAPTPPSPSGPSPGQVIAGLVVLGALGLLFSGGKDESREKRRIVCDQCGREQRDSFGGCGCREY